MTESLKSTPGGDWLDGSEIGALGPADAEDAVGVPNWFMLRSARRGGASG
jgi:hypothetical protein